MSDVTTPLDRDALAVSHLGLVRALARRHFAGKRPDLSDLESVGARALIGASRRFDPALGLKFSTLAGRRIVGAMMDELRRDGLFTRGEMPAARAGTLVRYLEPLDVAAGATVAPDVHDVIAARRLRAAIRRLPPREGKVIVWRYWRGLAQSEIAARLRVSDGRVSQIETRAIARLRAAIGEGDA